MAVHVAYPSAIHLSNWYGTIVGGGGGGHAHSSRLLKIANHMSRQAYHSQFTDNILLK